MASIYRVMERKRRWKKTLKGNQALRLVYLPPLISGNGAKGNAKAGTPHPPKVRRMGPLTPEPLALS